MFVVINFRGALRKYFNMKSVQLHIIEITVHVLPIMTSYLAIATSLLVLQRYLSELDSRVHAYSQTPSKTQSRRRNQTIAVIPIFAIGDKDSRKSHSQLIKP